MQARLASHFRYAHELRCDDLPDVALAPNGKPLGPHCYVVRERFERVEKVDIVAAEVGVTFPDAK